MEEKQQPKNNMIGRLIFFVFLAGILGAFWYFSRTDKTDMTAQKEDNTALRGSIVYVEGAVEYKTGDGEWKRASVGAEVKQGDSIEIIGEGKAIVNLDDGSAVRLNSDSLVEFTSLRPDNILITNNNGQIYTRVAQMNDRVFAVSAGDIIYESMGTAYKTINKEKIKGVEVYSSKVKVKGATDEDVVVEKGNKYLVVNDSDKKIEKTIVKIATADIEKDEFVKWNLAEDEKLAESDEDETVESATEEDEVKTAETTETVKKTETTVVKTETTKTVSTGAVTSLKISHLGSGKVSWTVSGYSKEGFKVVWSKNSGPTYPTRGGDKYKYYSNPDQRTTVIDPFDGYGTYYVRVCEYLGGKCGVYSNQITVKLEASVSGAVTSISLTDMGSGEVRWKASGYSESGYKLVWSKTSNPTYPCRSTDKYVYYSDPSTVTGKINAFDGEGKYYVRVCEYLGGKCGVYSNQIEITL
jgi:hypothetical protein